MRVFLSHSTADKPAVRELSRRLQEDGFEPWLDKDNLLPGENWHVEICKELRRTDVVLVCLTNLAVGHRGYLQKEILYALDLSRDGGHLMMVVRLEECAVPDRLRHLRQIDLFDEQGHERLAQALRDVAMTQVLPNRG